jgi:hypothetical protein
VTELPADRLLRVLDALAGSRCQLLPADVRMTAVDISPDALERILFARPDERDMVIVRERAPL